MLSDPNDVGKGFQSWKSVKDKHGKMLGAFSTPVQSNNCFKMKILEADQKGVL